MGDVTVLVLHPPLPAGAGPLTAALDRARRALAGRHVAGFRAAGAAAVRIVEESDTVPFGARLRRLAAEAGAPGLVVLGSGAMPLAGPRDYRAFVAAASADAAVALANNRFSADAIAVARADVLADLPDLPGDNALPRWLEEVAGYEVRDLRRRWRLGFDLDSPADAMLMTRRADDGGAGTPLAERLDAVLAVLADRRAQIVVAGRTSSATLAALERDAACRVRALVEERGLRASSRLAQSAAWDRSPSRGTSASRGTSPARGPTSSRGPVSVLGMLLDRDGPAALGPLLARLGDAAAVDSRVLIAHRLGGDEAGWPAAEERFASDLLLPERVGDPWLRELTASAAGAPIPVLLGGHTLVGPGLRLLAGRRSRTADGRSAS